MAKKPAAKKRSMTKRQYDDILYEVKDQVAWATINRPRVLNAFREQTLDELIDALKSTREDPSIACAVVTGAGDKAFSAGGDFYAMKRLNFVNGAMWNDRMQGLAMTIRGLPIPVIAMVNGWCMGGGHELVAMMVELLLEVWRHLGEWRGQPLREERDTALVDLTQLKLVLEQCANACNLVGLGREGCLCSESQLGQVARHVSRG
jgi:hypothetical protein